jgi:signal transduction histidine kinase
MDTIETGLEFVEKAIKEERQFIHSNGEVMPIEKVKHVSRESVEHLARHSNLITKERDDGDMIPDQLYSVEKLNDYAVYENRFLYTLLCYLRDFITLRYEKILELANRYDGVLKLNKTVVYHNRKMTYSVDLHDERKDDPILRDNNPAKPSIDRMDLMLKAVLSLLSTPLMEIAGKAPRLKPPITKTNVLKMDNNFKGAMALYEYVVAYDRPGYFIEEKQHRLAPFSNALADDLSEAGAMLSFLVYEYGLDLNERLKTRLEEAENREREEEILRRTRRLEQLKKKLEKGEQSPEEYILELEKHLRVLQSDNRQLNAIRNRLTAMEKKEERMRVEIEELKNANGLLHEQISETEIQYEREKADLRAEYEDRVYREITQHEAEMSALREDCEAKIRENNVRYNSTIVVLENGHKNKCESYEQRFREAAANYESTVQALNTKIDNAEEALASVTEERDRLSEKNLVCEARIKVLRKENGEVFDENAFTSEEDFNELERELEAFVKFYDERWGITKKAIRKKLLSYQSLKGSKGQK